MPIDLQREPELVIEWENLPVADTITPRIIKSWEVSSDFFVSTDGFSISAWDNEYTRLHNLEMEPVVLKLGDATLAVGRIDSSQTDGMTGATTYNGRDYIADMVECNIDPTIKISKDEQLGKIIRLAAKPVGIDSVVDDGTASIRNARTGSSSIDPKAPKSFKSLRLSDMKPQPGQGIYDFLNRLCARHGTTIQPALKRNEVTLQAPNYDQSPVTELVRSANAITASKNLVTQASCQRDYSSFPTYCLFTGKQSVTGGGTTDIKSPVPITDYTTALPVLTASLDGRIENDRILPTRGAKQQLNSLYRFLYFRDEQSRNQEQLDRAASRAVGERLRSTLVYNVTIFGHRDPTSGSYWAPDTIVEVSDEVCGINEPLWVLSRKFSYDEGGARTSLVMIRPHSITL